VPRRRVRVRAVAVVNKRHIAYSMHVTVFWLYPFTRMKGKIKHIQ
jgi:hypothetical protein